MRYGVMFIEYETHWKPRSDKAKKGFDDFNGTGYRHDIRKGVEFETDCLDTAKSIAIGFACFFTDTVFPVSDWRESHCWLLHNKQAFPTYDNTGFMESQLCLEVRLICLDTFYQHRRANV